ncbi:type IV secretory system conjugative DNA transfer family protein (plasmid) [Aneurinibacillus sp. Ricciae_BoGa-3]|uniref:type IV secretory system conjugative DNA transfer family protein n=1 Tax=Aneurinibacillus sp. Ricciae_BoGa-3 TaxID=3022697 RepID=UPI002340EA69|nr:type IV secretory system conjugative DNA transfer family protein [Aneurinibacillus sp. Ricciae_BoGa-3]WCK57736.1 type IV secretory system conjugative DNA transfer family protein [Aneurinibacillus sp. Ricciae_BoGa-3]
MSDPKEKLNKVMLFVTEQHSAIMTGLFTLQIANFLSGYLFHQGIFVITVALFFLLFLTFAISKDYANEKNKKYGFTILKLAVVVFLFSLVNNLFLLAFGSTSETKASSLFKLSYFLNVAIGISLFALMRKEETKKFLDDFYQNSLIEKLGFGKKSDTTRRSGDVKLAVNIETKKDEVLLFKDRFLHMLILGPTGSGKTSQTIIPMINQDMQNLECGITVIEPKADLAEKVYAMAQHYGRKVLYFNPILPDCPYFNPLFGKEEDVVENIATTFKMLSGGDSSQFFQDQNEILLRNGLKVLKRMMGNDCTFIDLYTLIANPGGVGRKMVMSFSRLNVDTAEIAKENSDISAYFLNDYFNEKSKTYEYTSGIRTAVAKIVSNKYLRKVLNPPAGKNDIDFDKHLEEGGVIAIATAQGTLRDLGRYLGYFIILQFQASVFRRPGNENTRRAHFLYIDEFQVYANPGFADMLTQGRSYRVASHLATQNRALIGMGRGQEGKDFIELVSTNARNIIIYPGGNAMDAKFYSDQFGQILKRTVQKGISRAKFNPIYGFQKISYPNESLRETEKLEARFSPSDIMYREFGYITYCIIKNNSIQTPAVGKIEYIPKELNDKLDKMIEEYNENIFKKPYIQEKEPEQPVAVQPSIQQQDVVVKEQAVDNFVAFEEETPAKTPKENKDYVPLDEEYTDDFVLQSTPKSASTGKEGDSPKEIKFMDDEEDELI